MPPELIAMLPLSFASWLLLAAGGPLAARPEPVRAGAAVLLGLVLGPGLLVLAGPFAWLALLVAGTLGLTAGAALRRSGRRPRLPSGAPLRALLDR